MAQSTLRHGFDESLGTAEMAIYAVLALLLSATIIAAIAMDGGDPDTAGVERVAHRTDARGDSAYGPHLHSLARSGHRAFSRRRSDCLDQAHPGN